MSMTPYNPDLTRSLKWLQNNAPNLQAIITAKQAWYTKYQVQFWSDWQANVFDIRTANAFGLVVWCIILGIPLDLFDFSPITNAFAFGAQRGNYLDGGGNVAPIDFVTTPTLYGNGVVIPSGNYTLNSTTDEVTFTAAPVTGTILSWTATVENTNTGQQLIVKQPRVFGTGDGTTRVFALTPSDSGNFNEVGNNFYGGGNNVVGLLTEIRQACQLRYVALVSNGRQQWINQMLQYIFNGGEPWSFPNKEYFYLTDNTLVPQPVASAAIWRDDWQGNYLMSTTPRTNISLDSPAFNATYWTSNDVALTTGQADPSGGTAATRIVDNATNAFHGVMEQSVGVSGGTQYTFSVYAKSDGSQYLSLSYDNGSTDGVFATFDLVNGVVSGAAQNMGSATGAASSIVAIANGWHRISITGTLASGDVTARASILMANVAAPTWYEAYAGTGTNGHFIFGSQLEQGSSATAWFATGTAPASTTDYSITNALLGQVTFSVAPLTGAALTWSGAWQWASTTAPQSFGTGNGTQTVFTLSAPPGAVPPVTASGYMEYRIGANMGISSQFLTIMNEPSYGIMPQCAGTRYAVVQES